MNGSCLIDFHHGWSIEVERLDQEFGVTCYSPYRKRLVLEQRYASDFEALQAAKQAINHRIARSSLIPVLRELYETGRLSFEEWNLLHQNLNASS